MTDWPTHRPVCQPNIAQLQPNHGTKSSIESPLPIDLIAHIESYLSFYQWSKAARVNHAWRNASLLPSSSPNQMKSVTSAYGYASFYLGSHARRSLRRLEHLNLSEAGADEWLTAVQSEPLPHFSHLQDLTFYDRSHPYHRGQRMGEYLATMSSTLCRIELGGSSFGPLSALAKLNRLQELLISEISISDEFNHALSQLVELWSVTISPKMPITYGNTEEGIEDRRLFSELVTTLSRLPFLTHMKIHPISNRCHIGDDPITAIISADSPVFSRVTHFGYECCSANLEVIQCIRDLGKTFPILTAFIYTQLCSEEAVADVHMQAWLNAFQVHFQKAIDSVRKSLTQVALSWPFHAPIDFSALDDAVKETDATSSTILSEIKTDESEENSEDMTKANSSSSSSSSSPLLLQVAQVRSAGVPVHYYQPENFVPTYVSHLSYLTRLELNYGTAPILSNFSRQILRPLVDLVHLEHLALMNVGLITAAEAIEHTVRPKQMDPVFIKRRDAHRTLKSVQFTPAPENQPNADLYINGQVLLSLIPRVEIMHFMHCQLSLESLMRIAQFHPVVWLPTMSNDPPAADGTVGPTRLVHNKTIRCESMRMASRWCRHLPEDLFPTWYLFTRSQFE